MQTYYVLGLAPKIFSLDLCALALFFEINKTADVSLSKKCTFLIGAEKGFLQCFCQKVIFATEVFVSI